jgi:hypothetical protein
MKRRKKTTRRHCPFSFLPPLRAEILILCFLVGVVSPPYPFFSSFHPRYFNCIVVSERSFIIIIILIIIVGHSTGHHHPKSGNGVPQQQQQQQQKVPFTQLLLKLSVDLRILYKNCWTDDAVEHSLWKSQSSPMTPIF